MTASERVTRTAGAATDDAAWSRVAGALRDALRDLRFGSIEIVVHDARVVQIERREKVRLPSEGEPR